MASGEIQTKVMNTAQYRVTSIDMRSSVEISTSSNWIKPPPSGSPTYYAPYRIDHHASRPRFALPIIPPTAVVTLEGWSKRLLPGCVTPQPGSLGSRNLGQLRALSSVPLSFSLWNASMNRIALLGRMASCFLWGFSAVAVYRWLLLLGLLREEDGIETWLHSLDSCQGLCIWFLAQLQRK